MNKKKMKARRKRWYKARLKAEQKARRKERFISDFRNHFVRKGIL